MFAQTKIVGHYHDYFSSNIYFNADSTFKYTWNADMLSSWTKGTWSLHNDTIFLKMIPVYDTLRSADKNEIISDRLILSEDEQPDLLIQKTSDLPNPSGQNFEPAPDKLFYRKGKLYLVKNGDLLKPKIRMFWTKRKLPPYYVRALVD